jgi:hypothetical protein
MLQPATPGIANCPFCIDLSETGGKCVSRALETAMTVTTSDASGLVHVAIPLFLFNHPMGALITGQVFDRYPDPMQLHAVARKINLPPERLWECARLEYPMRRETLLIYARLLETVQASPTRKRGSHPHVPRIRRRC